MKFKCNMSKLSLYEAEFENISLSYKNKSFRVYNVILSYSPLSLINRNINRIVVSGANPVLRVKDNSLEIDGMNKKIFQSSEKNKSDSVEKAQNFSLPFSCSILKFQNSRIKIIQGNKNYFIAFDAEAFISRKNNLAGLDFNIYPRGTRLNSSAIYDFSSKKIFYSSYGKNINPERFSDLLLNSKLKGSVFYDINTIMNKDKTVEGEFSIGGIRYAIDNIILKLIKFSAKFAVDGKKILFEGRGESSIVYDNSFTFPFDFRLSLESYRNTEAEKKYLLTASTDLIEIDTPFFKSKVKPVIVTLKTDFINSEFSAGFADCSFYIPDEDKLKLTGFSADLNFLHPCVEKHDCGSLRIKNICFDDFNIAALKLNIFQSSDSFFLKGILTPDILPKAVFTIDAELSPRSVSGSVNLNKTKIENLNLNKFHAAAEGFSLNTELSMNFKFNYNQNGNFNHNFTFEMKNSKLKSKSFTLDNFSLSLKFEDLFKMKSDPSQILKFSKLEIGEILLENGTVKFHMESADSLFIENFSAEWAGGKIRTPAFRLKSGKTNLDLVAVCDHVKLSEMLKQFGLTVFKGAGTVNGRIPFVYNNGKLRVKNGFLNTTPGESGVLSLGGQSMLQALPPNSPQYSQMDMTLEALNNFKYEWIKVKLNSNEQMLNLGLILYGKPASPLSYTIDNKTGNYIKSEVRNKGLFRPMLIEINFPVPVDMIIKYGEKMKKIYQNLFK